MSTLIHEAINNLVANAPSYSTEGNHIVSWDIGDIKTGKVQPSQDALASEVNRLQVEYDAQQFARDRVQEYPEIGDQLDALFHAGVFPPEMASQIQDVKDKFPKGE